MMEQVAVIPYDVGEASLAEPECALRDSVEDRLRIRRGAGDHLKNRARRGQITVARLQLSEQTHIFNGDDGLVGEGLQEIYLFFREWLNLCASERHHPDCDALAQ